MKKPPLRLWRKVETAAWDSKQIARLTLLGKCTWLLAITGPQTNRIGLMRFSIGEASERLSAIATDVRVEVDKLCEILGWRYDPDARVLLIPRWLTANTPDNESALRGSLKDLVGLPETRLLAEFEDAAVTCLNDADEESGGRRYSGRAAVIVSAALEERFGSDWRQEHCARHGVGDGHSPSHAHGQRPPARVLDLKSEDLRDQDRESSSQSRRADPNLRTVLGGRS